MNSISKDAEVALFRKYQTGDKTAFDKIYQQFQPLAMSRLSKLIKEDCMHLRAELQSEAIEALWKATESFDLKRGCRFSTYATKYIDLAIISKMSEFRKSVKRTQKYFQQRPLQAIAGNDSDDDGEIAVSDSFPCRDESILKELAPFCKGSNQEKLVKVICTDGGIWHKNGRINYTAIGRNLGISGEAVRQIISHLRSNENLKSTLCELVPH